MSRLIVKFCAVSFAIFVMALEIHAANVEWNMAYLSGDHKSIGYKDFDWVCSIEWPYLFIKQKKTDLGLLISAEAGSYPEMANTFVLANRGDIVSQSYMDSQTSYFAYAKYGDWEGEHADYSIILDDSESIYLAFVAVYAFPASKETRYGWLELGVREDGFLEVRSSAWDLDGDPIMVGAIPEPTSGLLLVVGMSFLALKRRRFSAQTSVC